MTTKKSVTQTSKHQEQPTTKVSEIKLTEKAVKTMSEKVLLTHGALMQTEYGD